MTLDELKKRLDIEYAFQSASEKEKWNRRMIDQGLNPSSYYQEVEMTSPFVNTHRDITYSYDAMSLHSHAFYEILCCRSSCGAEYLVGQYRYSLQKGDIILIRPGISHCAILPKSLTIPYERDIIWLSETFRNIIRKLQGLPPVSYENDLPTYLIRTAGTPWEFLCDMIHSGVLEEEKKQKYWQTNVIGNTIQVVSHLRRAYESQTALSLKAETPDLLDNIIAYIEDHFHEKLIMCEVAKQFYVSERSISSLFRKRLGTTFNQFLTQRRLIAAKSLILEGLPMDIAAERAGFANYSTFYRAFRKEFGIPPNIYRNQNTSN